MSFEKPDWNLYDNKRKRYIDHFFISFTESYEVALFRRRTQEANPRSPSTDVERAVTFISEHMKAPVVRTEAEIVVDTYLRNGHLAALDYIYGKKLQR